MSRYLRPSCAPAALLLGCVVVLFGCGGTREDRTITFSTAGDLVAFQHGREGVYVADKEGGGLTKIFTPDKDVIAVGTPLWAPNDKRLIFTTAHTLNGAPALPGAAATGDDPAGSVFLKQPTVYTCWLRDEPKGEATPEPRELFTAQVDDVGYVAAGLAVRWHPSGERIFYVGQDRGTHAIFEFDLANKTSHRISPDVSASAVVFDWSPDGTHLTCLLTGTPGGKDDGIWIRRDGADWWHVAESVPVAGQMNLPLERLKAARPAWTKDGRRFAFVMTQPGQAEGDPGRHFLWLGTLKGRHARQLLEEKQPLRDLLWHPEGERLGFLVGADEGTLRLTNLADEPRTVTPKPVRSFAGWNAKGQFLSYTTPDALPQPDKNGLSMLLFADPLARDVLWVAPGDGKEAGHAVVSGLRTTFVRWSPEGEKLSQWFTFSPTHRSLFSKGLDWGLRRGDPAAVIDAGTGAISWMAVDANEKAQVGHYHLLKRQYAEAWKWYEQAERDRKAEPIEKAEPAAIGRRPFRDFSFFAYYCLEKLGRREEASAHLAAFRERAPALLPADDPKAPNPALRTVSQLLPLARDLYIAEVFLSIDAAEDGEAFFRRALSEAKTDEDRLSAAVVLSQLLLLRGRTAEYATVATETIAPLLLQAWPPQKVAAGDKALKPSVVVGSLSLFPLARAEVLAALPQDRVSALADRWAALRAKALDDRSRLGADIVLEGLYRRLGRDQEAKATHDRIQMNPEAGGQLWTQEEVEKGCRELRGLLDWLGLGVLLNLRTGG